MRCDRLSHHLCWPQVGEPVVLQVPQAVTGRCRRFSEELAPYDGHLLRTGYSREAVGSSTPLRLCVSASSPTFMLLRAWIMLQRSRRNTQQPRIVRLAGTAMIAVIASSFPYAPLRSDDCSLHCYQGGSRRQVSRADLLAQARSVQAGLNRAPMKYRVALEKASESRLFHGCRGSRSSPMYPKNPTVKRSCSMDGAPDATKPSQSAPCLTR